MKFDKYGFFLNRCCVENYMNAYVFVPHLIFSCVSFFFFVFSTRPRQIQYNNVLYTRVLCLFYTVSENRFRVVSPKSRIKCRGRIFIVFVIIRRRCGFGGEFNADFFCFSFTAYGETSVNHKRPRRVEIHSSHSENYLFP